MLRLLSTLAFTAAAAFQAQAALPATCTRNATVALGDTCNHISAKHNVSTYQLAAVNTGIVDLDCTNLYPGEVLCLGLSGKDCNATYVVQPENTCTSISERFNIPVKTVLTNNPNLNPICTNLYPNEVLCISSKVYVNLTGSG